MPQLVLQKSHAYKTKKKIFAPFLRCSCIFEDAGEGKASRSTKRKRETRAEKLPRTRCIHIYAHTKPQRSLSAAGAPSRARYVLTRIIFLSFPSPPPQHIYTHSFSHVSPLPAPSHRAHARITQKRINNTRESASMKDEAEGRRGGGGRDRARLTRGPSLSSTSTRLAAFSVPPRLSSSRATRNLRFSRAHTHSRTRSTNYRQGKDTAEGGDWTGAGEGKTDIMREMVLYERTREKEENERKRKREREIGAQSKMKGRRERKRETPVKHGRRCRAEKNKI